MTLSHDGPIVTGANVTLVATLFEDDGSTPSGDFLFEWEDDDVPKPHKGKVSAYFLIIIGFWWIFAFYVITNYIIFFNKLLVI